VTLSHEKLLGKFYIVMSNDRKIAIYVDENNGWKFFSHFL